jgi:GxxExxY protein
MERSDYKGRQKLLTTETQRHREFWLKNQNGTVQRAINRFGVRHGVVSVKIVDMTWAGLETKKQETDQLTYSVIGAAIEVHRVLGPGLLESAYEECLCHELSLRSLRYRRQMPIPVTYKEVHLDCGYYADLVVSDELVIELKAVETIHRIHQAQLLTYMKLLELRKGLLINFHAPVLKEGIVRRVL